MFWVWIGPYFLFNVEPVVQYVYNIGNIRGFLQCRRKGDAEGQIKKHDDYLNVYGKIAEMKHREALWEAAPQVIIQIYCLGSKLYKFRLYNLGNLRTSLYEFVRFFYGFYVSATNGFLTSIFLSVIGIIITQFNCHKAYYIARGEGVNFLGASLMAVGYSIPLGK